MHLSEVSAVVAAWARAGESGGAHQIVTKGWLANEQLGEVD